MKNKRIKISTIFLLGLGLVGLQAQESVNATSGNVLSSGGSVSYSVGEISYQTHTGSNGSLAEGVQQPFEIFVVTGIEETVGVNLLISAYPNPTTDYLTLIINEDVTTSFDLSLMSFQLFDMKGKLIQKQTITENQTDIDMGNLVSATYFITVIQGKKNVKTFKIIKN